MQLVLPNNYVELEEEEMLYLDGGAYFSARDCRNIAAALAMSPGTMLAIASSAVVVSKILKYAKLVGGPLGWIISTAAMAGVGYVGKLASGIARGALSGKGVTMKWSWNPWDFGTKIDLGKK